MPEEQIQTIRIITSETVLQTLLPYIVSVLGTLVGVIVGGWFTHASSVRIEKTRWRLQQIERIRAEYEEAIKKAFEWVVLLKKTHREIQTLFDQLSYGRITIDEFCDSYPTGESIYAQTGQMDVLILERLPRQISYQALKGLVGELVLPQNLVSAKLNKSRFRETMAKIGEDIRLYEAVLVAESKQSSSCVELPGTQLPPNKTAPRKKHGEG